MKKARVTLVCLACGLPYEVYPCAAERSKTCSKACSYVIIRERTIGNQFAVGAKPNSGAFGSGHSTWNKGMHGIHLSPASEFQKGDIPANKVPVGTIRVRTSKRTGRKRSFVKTAEPNSWRLNAPCVWERHNGPIPKGMLVHHADRDTLNDDISNLKLESRASHLVEHRPEFEDRRRAALQLPRRAPNRLRGP